MRGARLYRGFSPPGSRRKADWTGMPVHGIVRNSFPRPVAGHIAGNPVAGNILGFVVDFDIDYRIVAAIPVGCSCHRVADSHIHPELRSSVGSVD